MQIFSQISKNSLDYISQIRRELKTYLFAHIRSVSALEVWVFTYSPSINQHLLS